MPSGTANYNTEELRQAIEDLTTISENLAKSIESTNMNSLDTRIRNYYSSYISDINGALSTVRVSKPHVQEAIDKYQTDYDALTATIADVNGRQGVTTVPMGDLTGGSDNGTKPGGLKTDDEDDGVDTEETNPGDPDDPDIGNPGTGLSKLPSDVQDKIKDALKDLGYTDDEIQKIIDGEITPDPLTVAKISDVLEECAKENPSLKDKFEEALGFDIFNEDGTVDKDKLALATLMASKGLDMDVDMRPGSTFSNMLDDLSDKLIEASKNNPNLRQQIIDKYGIDIFNQDGTINKERLAILKLMDGVNPNDDYDLENMFGIPRYEPPVTDPSDTGETVTPPTEDPGDVDTSTGGQNGDSGEPTEPSTGGEDPNVKPGNPNTNQPDPGEVKTGDSLGGGVIGTGGTASGSTSDEKGVFGEMENATSSAKEGVAGGLSSILETIGQGASKLASKVSPYTGGFGGQGGSVNSASAGIIAAASLAAGGAAAGGGLLIGKNMSYIHFTPEDWESLGEEYQSIIEKTMTKVGFSEDEIETFKNSKFRIRTSEIKEHVKKIEKATANSTDCEESLMKLYNFTMLDDNGKAIDYLLFITMIIDGKSAIDEYNMYNVINQSMEDVDDADFIYSGISMEDYFYDLPDDEDIKIANDPTLEKIDKEVSEQIKESDDKEEGFLEEDVPPSHNKEWLKGIGIDD